MKQHLALIEEMNLCPRSDEATAFWWLGQLGYAIKLQGKMIYIDAFLSDTEDRLVPPLLHPAEITNADYIIGTHDHIDHIDRDVWHRLSVSSPQAKFIVPQLLVKRLSDELAIPAQRFIGLNDGLGCFLAGNIRVDALAAAHELLEKDAKTGGYPCLGYVIRSKNFTCYHAGDTCIYEGLQEKLRKFGKIDVMFLPINGRDAKRYRENIIGNMTYQEAVDLAGCLQPALVVPGHYEMFAANSENPWLFKEYLAAKYPQVSCWIGEHGEKVPLLKEKR